MTHRREVLKRLAALACASWLAPARALATGGKDSTYLLVASERMGDPRFRETVLVVTQHGPGGPLGVILNRPTRFSRGDVLPGIEAMPDKSEPVFHGGPLEANTLYYMARFTVAPPAMLTLAPGVYMGRDLAALARIMEAGMRPAALRIYAGYAGWAPGQLEREIAQGSWHVLPLDAKALFEDDTGTLYPRLLARTQLISA